MSESIAPRSSIAGAPYVELSVSEIFSMSPQAYALIDSVKPFLSWQQLDVMGSNLRGEEKAFFAKAFNNIARITQTMPVTYEQDGLGDDAVVHIHYFLNGSDWWITELDVEDKVSQAFGLVQLDSYAPELGYISITELVGIGVGAELDLHWKPITLRQVRESLLMHA